MNLAVFERDLVNQNKEKKPEDAWKFQEQRRLRRVKLQKKQKQQGKVFTGNKGGSYGAREVKEQESCPNHQEQDPQTRKLHNVQISTDSTKRAENELQNRVCFYSF